MLDALAIGTVALVLEPLAELVLLMLEVFAALVETAFLAALLKPLLGQGAECRRRGLPMVDDPRGN